MCNYNHGITVGFLGCASQEQQHGENVCLTRHIPMDCGALQQVLIDLSSMLD